MTAVAAYERPVGDARRQRTDDDRTREADVDGAKDTVDRKAGMHADARHRPQDEVGREGDHPTCLVHPRAMVGEHEQRLARIEPHTHGVEDVQRRLTQALELLRLMEVQVRRTAQGDDRLSPQSLGRALCVGTDD